MKFVYPDFLYALIAIAIPIIIHLFNFRRYKTIYFTNVRFLKDIQEETQSANKLKHLLVLISRILAITFLVFAFAQPVLPSGDSAPKVGNSLIGIYLDNSFSMQAENNNGQLLDLAKNKTLSILEAYRPDDQFVLLTNDFEGKHQRAVNKEQFIELIQTVSLSPATKTIAEVEKRLKDIMVSNEAPNKQCYLISDFQKKTSKIEDIKLDTVIPLNFVPLEATTLSNLYIDSCWFYSPYRQANGMEKIVVKIINASGKSYENIPIRLEINGKTKTPGSFNIGPNESTTDTLSFTNAEKGIQMAKIGIKDYPITFDDEFYFNYMLKDNISIMVINEKEENKSLKALFGNDAFFTLTQSPKDQVNYSDFNTQQLIIVNGLSSYSSGLVQELKKFVSNGGSLFIASSTAEQSSISTILNALSVSYGKLISAPSKVDYINTDAPIYQNVFENVPKNLNLPVVEKYIEIKSIGEVLLRFQNRKPFLIHSNFDKGNIYTLATDLSTSASNFTEHAIFVPTLYNIALRSQRSTPLFYFLNSNNKIEVGNYRQSEQPLTIRGTSTDFIPEQRNLNGETVLFTHGQIEKAGNYNIYHAEDLINGVSFNYDRRESSMEFFNSEELRSSLDQNGMNQYAILSSNNELLSQEITENTQGFSLWKYCIILCLLFLGFEVILLRLYH
ncbi:hypothetical protein GYB57_14435 [bacterium]|nr:hypothetical protein [bacterium]